MRRVLSLLMSMLRAALGRTRQGDEGGGGGTGRADGWTPVALSEAAALWEDGERQRAIERLHSELEGGRGSLEVLHLHGSYLVEAQEYEEARKVLRQALDTAPEEREIAQRLAHVHCCLEE